MNAEIVKLLIMNKLITLTDYELLMIIDLREC